MALPSSRKKIKKQQQMGIIVARPPRDPLASITGPSGFTLDTPYHKRHYKDDVGVVQIEVTLDRPAEAAATVDFTHTGGTVGVDYTSTASPLNFAIGEDTKTIDITVIDKAKFFEYVEVVTEITGGTNVVIDGMQARVMTVIRPAVEPPVIAFDSVSSGVSSSGGAFSISANLAESSDAEVTFVYELGGTISQGLVSLDSGGTFTIPAGSTTGSISGTIAAGGSPGDTLEVSLLHEDGTIVPELAVRLWPSRFDFQEFHAEENAVGYSDPRETEQTVNPSVAGQAVFPGVPSAWGPGGTTAVGPPGSKTGEFIPQEDPSPVVNPFTGEDLPIWSFTSFITNGTPYIRESFADGYCDGAVKLGNPPLAEAYYQKSDVGMNVVQIDGFTASRAFVDVMKGASAWRTDPTGSFGFGTETNPTLDAQGWPVPVVGVDYATLIFWDGGVDAAPAGDYEVSWDGTGDVIFGQSVDTGFAVTARTNITSNSCTITVAMGATAGIYCRITGSSGGDPVRNVKIMRPGYTKDTRAVFTPELISDLERFSTIRFMDWQATNFSPITTFSDFVDRDYYSYASSYGVPISVQLELATECQANAWMCIPHELDDAGVTSWAQAIKDELAPRCRVYAEYTNEYWNATFGGGGQYDYVLTQANARSMTGSDNDKRAKFHAERSAEVFDLCDAVWRVTGSSVRRTRVLSGWIATTFNATTGLNHTMSASSPLTGNVVRDYVDQVCVAPYIGGGLGQDIAFETDSDAVSMATLTSDMDDMFGAASGANVASHVADYAAITNAVTGNPIGLSLYEAGQHIVVQLTALGGPAWSVEQDAIDKAHRLNRSVEMGTWYRQYVSYVSLLQAAGDIDQCCLYETVSKYADGSSYVGSFGLQEFTGQTDSEKWNAVLESAINQTQYWNPAARGSLMEYNRISYYVAIPQGRDAHRADGVKYAQISLRNRNKNINHVVTFRLDFPGTVGQLDKSGSPTDVLATSIGNVGIWDVENPSGVTPLSWLDNVGVEEDANGVRIWYTHHADGVTLYTADYANIGDVDDDGISDISGQWPDRVGVDSANPILRPCYTDSDILTAIGGISKAVGKGMMFYGIMHERSSTVLSGAPGRYRRNQRLWWEPEGLAVLEPAGNNLHTITLT